jgi:hypothetical protein
MEGKPAIILHPVGSRDKLDKEELDSMARQARKATGLTVEIGPEITIPPGAASSSRGQIIASRLLASVPAVAEPARPAPPSSPYGGGLKPAVTPRSAPEKPAPFARVAVTDQDLFAPGHEYVFSLGDPKGRRAVVTVKRLREAFYRRKSDPARQRARAAREFIAAVGAARGLPPCQDPHCVMSAPRTVMDIDRKNDRFCGTCNNHIRGRMRW